MDATEEQWRRAREYAAQIFEGHLPLLAHHCRTGQEDSAPLVKSALAAIIDGDRREAELRAEIERLREAMRTAAAALILIDKALNADKGAPNA